MGMLGVCSLDEVDRAVLMREGEEFVERADACLNWRRVLRIAVESPDLPFALALLSC